jgi:hypothetical protein
MEQQDLYEDDSTELLEVPEGAEDAMEDMSRSYRSSYRYSYRSSYRPRSSYRSSYKPSTYSRYKPSSSYYRYSSYKPSTYKSRYSYKPSTYRRSSSYKPASYKSQTKRSSSSSYRQLSKLGRDIYRSLCHDLSNPIRSLYYSGRRVFRWVSRQNEDILNSAQKSSPRNCTIDEALNSGGESRCNSSSECTGDRWCSSTGLCGGPSNCGTNLAEISIEQNYDDGYDTFLLVSAAILSVSTIAYMSKRCTKPKKADDDEYSSPL